MSTWATEFGKIKEHYKMALVFVALLLPFWYVYIFLFDRQLYEIANIYLSFCLTFTLALTFYTFNCFLALAFLLMVDQFFKDGKSWFDLTMEETLRYGGGFSFMYIVMLIAEHQLFKDKKLNSFSLLVYADMKEILATGLVYFVIYLVVRLIILIVKRKKISGLEKQQNTLPESDGTKA